MKTILAIAALISVEAQAGTYNFYFNNTEQGDSSTANPTVVVDGAAQKPQPKPSPFAKVEAAPVVQAPVAPALVPAVPAQEAPVPTAEPPATEPHAEVEPLTRPGFESGARLVRPGTSWLLDREHPSLRFSAGRVLDWGSHYGETYVIDGTVFLSKRFALTAFGMAEASRYHRIPVFGGEAEFQPIQLENKAFWDGFDLGLFAGAGSWEHGGLAPHFGARASAFWFKRFGASLVYRHALPNVFANGLHGSEGLWIAEAVIRL